MKTLVTSYTNPDLDGTACAFAYTEFLQKTGKNAQTALFGSPHREAQFVMEKFNIPDFKNAEDFIDDVDGIVLVDASDLNGISDKIKPEKVTEIIDHRKIHEAHKFPNAKAQIELVGSAATLIAEKFYSNNIEVSKESAALLYSAIVSNTINFKANVTTDRDVKMAKWLKTKVTIPENYIHEMFSNKSQFKKSLEETLIDDFATFKLNNINLGIAQLEMVGVDEFINDNTDEIKKNLEKLKKEKSLNLIFFTCIDLENGFNKIVVIDEKSQKIVEKALKVKFNDMITRRESILMRKEMVPLMKKVLEDN